MRVLVVSDIHSNLVALDAVLADASLRGGFERVWCLGDTVGYGPEPMACLERLRDVGAASVRGNHDAAAVGAVPLDSFNPVAATACRWTSLQLNDEARAKLQALPLTLTEPPFTLVHGTPNDPTWEYLVTHAQAEEAWKAVPTLSVLVGHSHLPFAIRQGMAERPALEETRGISLLEARWVINPGSVGQPRDGDPRAAYGVYDSDRDGVELRRVGYDVGATQRRMAELGLPEPLITRLAVGR